MKSLKNEILDLVTAQTYLPLTPNEMISLFNNNGYDFDEGDFWRAIHEMEGEDFSIAFTKKNKIVSAESTGQYKGVYSASAKGSFGFVTTEKGEELFIPPSLTFCALNGDTVICKRLDRGSRFFGKGNEAEVIAILDRGFKEIIGTLTLYPSGKGMRGHITPDNERIKPSILVDTKSLGAAQHGEKVVAKITSYPRNEQEPIRCEITEVLGKADSQEANYRAILHANGISTAFSDSVLREADEVSKEEIIHTGRRDFRNDVVFTIDSHEAKDLDDAISIKVTENGYILGVHIADVSHYVRKGSALDNEAFKRGTSVYFTDKVVPMLPKALSNFICSLNEGVDRLTLSAIITLDKSGNILYCELVPSVIRSKIKGIYAELNHILENGENSEFYPKYAHVLEDFYKMYDLYKVLSDKSSRRGAMELESEETKIILDESGHPIEIVKAERGETERLIEQFMLCANEAVASYLYNAGMPCVYRVHDEPDLEKIQAFSLFARNLGVDVYPLRTKNKITSSQLTKVLDSAKERGCYPIVSSILLRSLMKARYSSVQKPHFGLSTEFYCHFTSPIRRYPDLSVHRIIKAMLKGEINERTIGEYESFAMSSAIMSSDNEVNAVHAERDIDDLYKCVYMHDRIGEEYEAVICSVTPFGFFAKTENLCEGLVPIESLGQGFFYDRDNYTLSRGRTTFRLGQRVRIKVEDADVSARRITFSLVKDTEEKDTSGWEEAPKKPLVIHKGAKDRKDKGNHNRASSAARKKQRRFETFMQLAQKRNRKRR
ncbi:MAG: ribonuclease R [Clostridia bacterium]|nr:ribonuclease R [Clostridia bacterium]